MNTPQPKCRLLAVDVDGTLLYRGLIHPEDAQALRAAARAGIVVCLCTGRAWPEVRDIWRGLDLPRPHAPVVCVGGALVAEPDTGRSLYTRAFDRPTAGRLAAAIRDLGYPVMALVDAWREGFDYYLLGSYEDYPLYRRFFDGRDLRVRRMDALGGKGDPPPLRISLLAEKERAFELVGRLRERFGQTIEVQTVWLHGLDLHIVEAFAPGANKFIAVRYVGQGCGIGPGALAAIGDDYNDLPLLSGAAISATTADAPEELRRAAGFILARRGEKPVAEFVGRLLSEGDSGP